MQFFRGMIFVSGTNHDVPHYEIASNFSFTPSSLLYLNIFFVLKHVSCSTCDGTFSRKEMELQTDKDCSTFQTEHSLGKNLE